MIVLGIDNGVGGGIVQIHDTEGIVFKSVMPVIKLKSRNMYDIEALVKMIGACSGGCDHVFIEKAQAMPKQGTVSMFHYGEGFGIVQGIVAALEIPFTLVTPQAWQKEMFEGLSKDEDTKVLGLIVCKRLYPKETWTATDRSKKFHTGMTDACCIATYGLRKLKGELYDSSKA
jgi:hypothetical protein